MSAGGASLTPERRVRADRVQEGHPPSTLEGDPTTWESLIERVARAEGAAVFPALVRCLHELEADRGPPPWALPMRVALLGGASTDLFADALRVALLERGVLASLSTSGFDQIVPEMMDRNSETSLFRPEVALVLPGPARALETIESGLNEAEVDRQVEATCESWLGLCTKLHERCGTTIVMDNFPPPLSESLGHLASETPGSARDTVRRLNLMLGQRAPEYVHVHDLAALVERHGLRRWIDLRLWYHAKQAVSPACLPSYLRSLSSVVGAVAGKSKKCIVLDLDGTLWKGVIGEDGLDGIGLGEGTAAGEAHKAFQLYLRELKRRGILLAVCSKNDLDAAEEPFRSHPETVLRLDDFASFRANWRRKSENIRAIAEELNIGTDSIVFVDDNPAERLEVRRALPEVAIPELPPDAAEFIPFIEDQSYFEAIAISTEDRQRTTLYRRRKEAEELESSADDYESYLRDLEMQAVVGPFQPDSMGRITQLINKTNQFNLTTLRLPRPRVEELASNADWVTSTVRLMDRFGEHGLISVLAAQVEGQALRVDLWLMSCRVIRRGVEHLVLDRLVEEARARGLLEVRGRYIPTERNGIVRDLYSELGFARTREDEGETHWVLDLKGFQPLTPAIEVRS